MICKACAEAGDMLASIRPNPANADVSTSMHYLALDVIRLKHQECAGPTACDCLHRIT